MKRKIQSIMLTACCLAIPVSALASCNRKQNNNFLEDIVERTDYRSVYQMIGKNVTLDQVTEESDGRVYITVDNVRYELGMDFLSMAMVYNATPTAAFPTATAAYNEWWRLYIQRWNWLVPEVPLYSNQFYDVYNAKIDRLQTNAYWDVTDAIVSARVIKGDNAVILGSNTELSGAFRDSAFGKSAPGAADLAVQTLTSGYKTVTTNDRGEYVWAGREIVRSHEEVKNDDGTKTFTVRIADDLTFSNGEKITAKHYLVSLLAGSSKVLKEAGGSDAAGLALVGYEDFHSYDGTGTEKPFTGVRLLDEYTFSVTVKKEYADYYYALRYGAFTPQPTALYLCDFDIRDDGNGAYIQKDFYEKVQANGINSYKWAGQVRDQLKNVSNTAFPYSGPYYVESYNASTRTAELRRNTRYKGDVRGVAAIDRISYVHIVTETQLDQLRKGRVDVLSGVTGGEETRAALALVDGVNFKETHYDRAGYGKLAFRCDFGPTQFAQVRRAVMHTIDRGDFAQTFTGGYGTVVHAPYYTGSATYLAVKDRLKLEQYEYSIDKAKAQLEEGGWVYNADGSAYSDERGGVRYKKLSGYELSHNNLAFASTDNKYKTIKVKGEYYMPLVINWMGTQPNTVTDQLITAWQSNSNATSKIGAYVTYSSGNMHSALYGEYYQMPAYGFTKATYGAVNFATGFTSAAYDVAFAWTIDQDMYSTYSSNFLMDEADFLSVYGR